MVVLVSFGQGTLAKETSNYKLSKSEKKEIARNFDTLGIDEATQKKLIEKIENGEVIDAMKEENLQKAADDMQNIALNESKTITFEDGSKIKYGTKLENVNESDIKLTASPGSYTAKSYWYTGILNYSFYSDFVIRSGKNNDYITDAYNPILTLIGPGSYTGEKASVIRRYETSTRFAYSRMDFKYSVPTGSSNVSLYFNVGNNSYKTTLSLKDIK